MKSNAADVNISALLNLGAKPRVDKTVSEGSKQDDSFERHLSEQSSKTETQIKRSVEPQERTDATGVKSNSSESTSGNTPDAGGSSSDTDEQAVSSQDESTEKDSAEDHGASGEREGDQEGDIKKRDLEEPVTAANGAQPQTADALAGVEMAAQGLAIAPEETALVSSAAQTEDLLIDVPAQASISLESLVAAVRSVSVTEPQSSGGEAVGAVLDDLVDGLDPLVGAGAGAGVATAGLQLVPKPVGAQPAASSAGAASALAAQKALAEGELDVDSAELERIVTSIDTKGGAAKPLDLAQPSNPIMGPSRQALNQQMVANLAPGVADTAIKDQQPKLDLSSTAREPSALLAVSQRTAARPVSVQQGSAQFAMPNQAKPGQPQWQTAVSERVAIMATQRITSAEIQLDPPELGQLQVRVTLNQDQASVSFASQHAVVREALDQTAHRLREMFDGEGLNLVDVDVSDQSFQQQRENAQGGSLGGDVAGDEEQIEEPIVTRISQGLVDHFV